LHDSRQIGEAVRAMAITAAEIEREKRRLPRGWGRFGKALDRLAELSEPGESLLAACVALNPEFTHRSVTLVGGLNEITKATNVVLALTDARLIMLATGMGGKPRHDASIPRDGLRAEPRSETEFVLTWPDGGARIRGAAQQMAPALLAALGEPAQPGAYGS
jgi:hypothetical protein